MRNNPNTLLACSGMIKFIMRVNPNSFREAPGFITHLVEALQIKNKRRPIAGLENVREEIINFVRVDNCLVSNYMSANCVFLVHSRVTGV